jgi:hypothetical protein
VPSFSQQMEDSRVAHTAVTAIDEAARLQISAAYSQWEAGDLTDQSVRWRLEAIVRQAYRASAQVGAEAARRAASDIPGWKAVPVFNNEYLQDLLKDVRRNLREYKKSERTEADRRRAVLYTQHSAGVGAQRGYTDSLIESYANVEALGYEVIKIWLANFVNNEPCVHCRSLHGTKVGLRDVFKVPTKTLKIYRDLQGPPRHPRCHCYLCILVVNLENAFEEIEPLKPPTPPVTTMTTDEVKKIPKAVFSKLTTVLKKIQTSLKGTL